MSTYNSWSVWAVLWRQRNQLDGRTEHLVSGLSETGRPGPVLFASRGEAPAWGKEKYGYIKLNPHLGREPFGWRAPKVVRVVVRAEVEGQP